MEHRIRRRVSLGLAALLACGCASHAATAAEPDALLGARRVYAIPVQPLAAALMSFSRQSDLQVMTSSADLDGLNSTAVLGEHTAREALAALLRGTGLEFHPVSDTAVSIEPTRKHVR